MIKSRYPPPDNSSQPGDVGGQLLCSESTKPGQFASKMVEPGPAPDSRVASSRSYPDPSGSSKRLFKQPPIATAGPQVNCCGGGPYWQARMRLISVGIMETQASWVMVSPSLLRRAEVEIPSQSTMGDDTSWGCGPNASARAAVLLGGSVDWKSLVDCCPRTFQPPPGIPEPWPKVGPAPEPLAEYLDNRAELFGFWVRAARTGHWGSVMEHFRYHLQRGRPVIVLLSLEAALQHYVCVVAIDESRGLVAILNTNGDIWEASISDLQTRMDADGTWGRLARQFSQYNLIRFDLADEREMPRSGSSINQAFPPLLPAKPADPNRNPFDCNPPNQRCVIC